MANDPGKQKKRRVSGVSKIVNTQLAPFSRQLASMLRAGMSLVVSLMTIEEQMDDPNFKIVLADVRDTVESGGSFSDGLAKWPQIFNELYVNIVRSGERSGQFSESMARLSTLLESSAKLRRKVKSALSYPIVVICMALGISFAMITFVVPVFSEMFASFGKDLPAPTQLLVDISHFITHRWYVILFVAAVSILSYKNWAATEKGSYKIDEIKLKMPIFGKLNQKVAASRFSRIFSQMVHSGVPILDGLSIVSKAVGNKVVGKSIMQARSIVEQGEPLSVGLEGREGIPLLLTRMAAAGEKSGKLDEMLDSIADTYDDEVDAMLASLTSLMEPMLMGFMGALIGSIVIAMYLPIFKMSSIIGN